MMLELLQPERRLLLAALDLYLRRRRRRLRKAGTLRLAQALAADLELGEFELELREGRSLLGQSYETGFALPKGGRR